MTFADNIRSISPHFTTSRTSANAQTSTSAFYRSPLCTVFCYWDRRRVSSFPLGYQQVVTLTIIQLRPLILCKMLIKTFIKTFDAEAQIAQIKTILTTKRKQWFNRNKYVNIFTLPSSFLLLPGTYVPWNLLSSFPSPWNFRSMEQMAQELPHPETFAMKTEEYRIRISPTSSTQELSLPGTFVPC